MRAPGAFVHSELQFKHFDVFKPASVDRTAVLSAFSHVLDRTETAQPLYDRYIIYNLPDLPFAAVVLAACAGQGDETTVLGSFVHAPRSLSTLHP